MAHGRPDFFGVSIHPRLGTSRRLTGTVVVPADSEVEIVGFTGKGVCIGGFMITLDADALASNVVRVEIDGLRVINLSWSQALSVGLFGGDIYPAVLTHYDEDIPKYACSFPEDLPFEDSISFRYYCAPGNDVTVTSEFTYYSVE